MRFKLMGDTLVNADKFQQTTKNDAHVKYNMLTVYGVEAHTHHCFGCDFKVSFAEYVFYSCY